MAVTAFQPNAFQVNAFQIGISGGSGRGISSHAKPKRIIVEKITQEEADKLLGVYEEVSALPEAQEIVLAVDSYIGTLTQEEWGRRMKAQLAVSTPPPAERIDFVGLYENIVARNRFMRAIERIKLRILELRLKRQKEEGEFLMLMLMGA